MLIYDAKVHILFILASKFVILFNIYKVNYRLFMKNYVTLQTYEKKHRIFHRL